MYVIYIYIFIFILDINPNISVIPFEFQIYLKWSLINTYIYISKYIQIKYRDWQHGLKKRHNYIMSTKNPP